MFETASLEAFSRLVNCNVRNCPKVQICNLVTANFTFSRLVKVQNCNLGSHKCICQTGQFGKGFLVTIWSGKSHAYLYMIWINKDTVRVGDVRRTICLIKSPGHKKSETKKTLESMTRYCVGGLCRKKYLIQVWLSSQDIRAGARASGESIYREWWDVLFCFTRSLFFATVFSIFLHILWGIHLLGVMGNSAVLYRITLLCNFLFKIWTSKIYCGCKIYWAL